MLQDPNSRSESELIVIRAFKDAAYKMLDREERQVRASGVSEFAHMPATQHATCTSCLHAGHI